MIKDDFKNHISKRFDTELESLCNQFIAMGGLVEQQVADAIRALTSGDVESAEAIINNDREVNEYERLIDEKVELILAKRQPTAADLRLTIMLSKATTDLERIGDEAVKIARAAVEVATSGHSPLGYSEVRSMSNQARLMIHDSLNAFARFDADQAYKVMRSDLEIDQQYQTSLRSLITYIMEDNRYISQVISLMWVLRSIERVGDHARNVAEQVIFVISGEDVRHLDVEQIPERIQLGSKE